WSSGGKLKGPEMFQYLGIPEQEKLLAAVFIEYPEMRDDSRERKPGSLRNDRSDQWIREVTL
ncbi:MAG: nitroreductase, partial [Planctomycetaceae bacterium]|nr:nitroreductase [Planctomycetaceae bacterium]